MPSEIRAILVRLHWPHPAVARLPMKHIPAPRVRLVIAVVSFLLGAELILRVVGYGNPATRPDPFFGFEGAQPVFELRDIPGEGRFYVPAPRRSSITQRFPAQKSANTYRVFTLGGSTTYGIPYGPDAAFSFWLNERLSRLYPQKNIEVINAGVPGYGSARVLQILEEVAAYQPDLLVVYTGQNETRDARFHYWELKRGHFRARLLHWMSRSRLLYLTYETYVSVVSLALGPRQTSYAGAMIEGILSAPFSRTTFKSFDYLAVPPIVDEQQDAGQLNETRAKRVLKSILRVGVIPISSAEVSSIFEQNVERMIEAARRNGIKIAFLRNAMNPKFRDVLSIPPVTISSKSFGEEAKRAWGLNYANGIQNMKEGKWQEALRDFERVRGLCPTCHDSLLLLYQGRCLEELGHYEEARREYESRFPAEDLELNDILDRLTRKHQIALIDVYELLKAASANGIVGYENFFTDTVHLTLDANKLIGAALTDFIRKEGYIRDSAPATPEATATVARTTPAGDPGLARYDTAAVTTALGWASFNNGKVDEALDRGRKAVAQDRAEIQAHLLLGYVYTKLGRLDDARSEWETLKQLYRNLSRR